MTSQELFALAELKLKEAEPQTRPGPEYNRHIKACCNVLKVRLGHARDASVYTCGLDPEEMKIKIILDSLAELVATLKHGSTCTFNDFDHWYNQLKEGTHEAVQLFPGGTLPGEAQTNP